MANNHSMVQKAGASLAEIQVLKASHDQAQQRLAKAQRALSAAQSEYQQARKVEHAALLALVEAKEARQ